MVEYSDRICGKECIFNFRTEDRTQDDYSQQSDKRKIVHGYMEAERAFKFRTQGPRSSKAALQRCRVSYVIILSIIGFKLFKFTIKIGS